MLLRSYHGHRHQVQYLYHSTCWKTKPINTNTIIQRTHSQSHASIIPLSFQSRQRQRHTTYCSSCQDSFCSQMERLNTGSPGALPLTTFEMFTPTLGVTGHLLNCCALALTPIAISKAKSNVNFFIHSFLTMLSKIKYAITKITFCHSPFVITFLCTNFLHRIRLSNLQLDYIDVTSIIKAKHIRIRKHTRIRQGN